MIRTPAHKQTNPALADGVVSNPAPAQAMQRTPRSATLAEYIASVQASELFHRAAQRLVRGSEVVA